MADGWYERTKQYWYLPVANGITTGAVLPIRLDDESLKLFKKDNHRVYDSFERAEHMLTMEKRGYWAAHTI